MVTVLDDEADPLFNVLKSTAEALFLRSELTLQNNTSERELEGNAHSRLRNRHLSVLPVMSCRP